MSLYYSIPDRCHRWSLIRGGAAMRSGHIRCRGYTPPARKRGRGCLFVLLFSRLTSRSTIDRRFYLLSSSSKQRRTETMKAILVTVVAATLTVGHAVRAQEIGGLSGMTASPWANYVTSFSPSGIPTTVATFPIPSSSIPSSSIPSSPIPTFPIPSFSLGGPSSKMPEGVTTGAAGVGASANPQGLLYSPPPGTPVTDTTKQ